MDTIAATIERLIKAEYGRPAPPHFQREAAALLRDTCATIQRYLSKAAEKGEDPGLSKGFTIHFPIPAWDWDTSAAPVLSMQTKHFEQETSLLVSPLPDSFASDVPRNTYLTLARGAVYRWRDSGPLPAYHLYLTPGQIEKLKGLEEGSARDFFIKQRYIPARLYETAWTLSAGDVDFIRKLTISLFAVQLQEDKRLAALPVVLYLSSKIDEKVWTTMERDEVLVPPDFSGEELTKALANLEAALEGKEPPPAGPQTAEMFPPEAVESTKLPAALTRNIAGLTGDLADLYDPENIRVPDFVKDGERRRQMQEQLDAGKILIVGDGIKAHEADRQYILDLGEEQQAMKLKALQKKLGKTGRTLDDDALVKAKPSKDDIIRAGLSEISLGILGAEIQFALLHLAWQQRHDGHLGLVKLKSWNQLCRTINPDFDKLKRGPRNNYRRRVKRKVLHMTRLRSLWTYNQLGRERLIDTLWVSFLDDETPGENTVYIRPGLFDNLYVVAVAVAAFQIGRRLTSRNEKTLFWRLWGETRGTETRSIAVLVEWGDWRSFDREQNRRALARTLARLVELGYLKEATLTPDGESYRLVKATGHHFPPKQIEGEKAPPVKAGGADRPGTTTGTKQKKAYPRKRRRRTLPRDGE